MGLGGGRASTWGVENGPRCVPGALGESWLIICKATGSFGIKTRFLVQFLKHKGNVYFYSRLGKCVRETQAGVMTPSLSGWAGGA